MSATAENPPAAQAAGATATATATATVSLVEERVTARVITDDPLYRKIPVSLRFVPAEPLAVRIVFPADLSPEGTDNEWAFPRALLEAGLLAPTGTGDVRVWPCGRVQAVVEFHSPDGVAVIQFDIAALRRFLRRTYSPATR
ncbi:SsgA family sporulation/cell division regulator [Streptomyces xanthophaeus]|uniref:Cell division protein n=1 Tax=Streptomyces xanthophaeus TaxID=67385 RepID=A0A919H815_9ACTN|nr:SsgA family sporulation/cell division regulator [Streptomyces xanthophaeus]WST22960.1 SsgA family sporulation/cell division regulator [Streptomyces xanthophaeus]WST62064.1 SsgA family sporulation/cell division regulator [Streptomyces xanthophaeus]GHI89229.1 cell division protein [Streptomyces xanthophaeus]